MDEDSIDKGGVSHEDKVEEDEMDRKMRLYPEDFMEAKKPARLFSYDWWVRV